MIRFIVFSAFSLALSQGQAITLNLAGGTWQPIVSGYNFLQAGDDLNARYESHRGQAQLTIDNSINPWQLKVRRAAINWPADVVLEIRRTSDGTDSGSSVPPTGGETYIEITTWDTVLFSGEGNRSDIDLQFRLRGISVELGIKDYFTEITYTVED